MVSYLAINEELKSIGMCLRGGFLNPETGMTHLLIGNVGSEIWEPFCKERDLWEYYNPLDSWTRSKLMPIAEKYGIGVVFPFEGPEYHPFHKWALKADDVYNSPIGYLIHPEFGLWHAYRGAYLSMHEVTDLPESSPKGSPCESCLDKPCLSACPVDAFKEEEGYDVSLCIDHLHSNQGGQCMKNGCLARNACPVGLEYKYNDSLTDFHMGQFIVSDFIR